MNLVFDGFQKLGRALMLPIAVLPVAGLLLRLGQPDLLGIPMLAASGDAIFQQLGLVFAIGVAVGLARENHGAAGLAGVVGFLVATKGAEALLAVPPGTAAGLTGAAADALTRVWREDQVRHLSVPIGILAGLIAGAAYNRFSEIRLPAYLAFFGGRRFVPIATGFAGIGLALVFGLGWPILTHGMDALSHAVLGAGSWGLFAYGVLNRILIITGLHHILNNLAWFLLGEYHGATGDLHRFFAGDPSAGAFMSGFFPVMMFGLPGACLAMYHAARPERRAAVGGLLLSLALTSFLTGVTEPIEFTFMFLAPALYAVHALLTGVAMALMHALGIHLGFSFSAGLFDYVLNYSRATRALWLLPIGLAYFGLYYGLFRYGITRFQLATPGREPDVAPSAAAAAAEGGRADEFIAALGGAHNLVVVEACMTRLRLTVGDGARVDDAALARLGARGVIRPAAGAVQVVLGPIADQVASEIRRALKLPAPAAAPAGGAVAAPPAGAPLAREALLAALGGAGNLESAATGAGRLLLRLKDPARLDGAQLRGLGVRGVARPGSGLTHLLLGAAAAPTHAALIASGIAAG